MWNPLEVMGNQGDSLIAHITPREAMILKAMGGIGTRNKRTGYLQFYSGDSGDTGDSDSDAGNGVDSSDTDTGMESADRDAVGAPGNVDTSDMDIGSSLGYGVDQADMDAVPAPRSLNEEDMDIGKGNLSFGQTVQSFMGHPTFSNFMSMITPSWSTGLGFAGAVSPVPGGMLLGRAFGSALDKHGTQPNPEGFATAERESASRSANLGGMGGVPGWGLSDPISNGISPTNMGIHALANPMVAEKPDRNAMWAQVANRGGGGGTLARLFQ